MGSKVQRWIIAVAIAIVFNLFVNYGVATFYPGPEYSDYCNENRQPFVAKPIGQNGCPNPPINETLRSNCTAGKGSIDYKFNESGCPVEEICQTCHVEYDTVRNRHDGNVFAVLLLVSVAILAAGIATKAEAVSTGFLLAGIIGLIIASTRYWEHLQNIFRFLLLGAALAVLIWIGYKKVR